MPGEAVVQAQAKGWCVMVTFATFDNMDAAQAAANRAVQLGLHKDALDALMDLCAVHAGCPIDIEKLLSFDDFNFAHDIGGIKKHLNRATGLLENHFLPRCALPMRS